MGPNRRLRPLERAEVDLPGTVLYALDGTPAVPPPMAFTILNSSIWRV